MSEPARTPARDLLGALTEEEALAVLDVLFHTRAGRGSRISADDPVWDRVARDAIAKLRASAP